MFSQSSYVTTLEHIDLSVNEKLEHIELDALKKNQLHFLPNKDVYTSMLKSVGLTVHKLWFRIGEKGSSKDSREKRC